MVVDYNRVKASPKALRDGVLWVAEQIPGKVIAKDQVQFLDNFILFGTFFGVWTSLKFKNVPASGTGYIFLDNSHGKPP